MINMHQHVTLLLLKLQTKPNRCLHRTKKTSLRVLYTNPRFSTLTVTPDSDGALLEADVNGLCWLPDIVPWRLDFCDDGGPSNSMSRREGSLDAKRFMADGAVRAKSAFFGSSDEGAETSPKRRGEDNEAAAGEVAASKMLPKVDLREDAMNERLDAAASFALLFSCARNRRVGGDAMNDGVSTAATVNGGRGVPCRAGHNAAFIYKQLPQIRNIGKTNRLQRALRGVVVRSNWIAFPFVASRKFNIRKQPASY